MSAVLWAKMSVRVCVCVWVLCERSDEANKISVVARCFPEPRPPRSDGPILSALLAPAINICNPASACMNDPFEWVECLSVCFFFFPKFRSRFEQTSENCCAVLNGRWWRGLKVAGKQKEKRGQRCFFFWDGESLKRRSQKVLRIKAQLLKREFPDEGAGGRGPRRRRRL